MTKHEDHVERKDRASRRGIVPGFGFLAAVLMASGLAVAADSPVSFAFPTLDEIDLTDRDFRAVGPRDTVRLGDQAIRQAPRVSSGMDARQEAGRHGAVESRPQRASLVIVNDDWVGLPNGTPVFFNDPGFPVLLWAAGTIGTDAFATIQDAVDAVDDGGEIRVAAGFYPETFTAAVPNRGLTIVQKQVRLLGPNFNNSPNDATPRNAEAVIVPGPSGLQGGPIPVVGFYGGNSSGSEILGFTIDGDNPGINTGFVVNGADFDASIGLLMFQTDQNTIANNIVRNVDRYGISGFWNGPVGGEFAGVGSTITQNLADNIVDPAVVGLGISYLVANNYYADILDNATGAVRTGIQTNNHRDPADRTYTIDANFVTVSHFGIYHNLQIDGPYGSASPFEITNNTVLAQPQPFATLLGTDLPWEGIRIESITGATPVLVDGNFVDGDVGLLVGIDGRYTLGVYGVRVRNPFLDSNDVTISNNTILNAQWGIANQANGVLTVVDNPVIAGHTIAAIADLSAGIDTANNGIAGSAIGILAAGGTVTGFQNSIADGDFGVVVSGAGIVDLCENTFDNLTTWNIDVEAGADPTAQTIRGNTFDGTGDGVRNQNPDPLDARGNYWGSPLGPNTMASNTTSGNVVFLPWQLLPGSPAIECPEDLTVECDDITGATVILPAFNIADTCDGTVDDVVATYEIPDLGLSGLDELTPVLFPIGITEVQLVATDPNGPPAICTFFVEVTDDAIPPARFVSIPNQDGFLRESSPGFGIANFASTTQTTARVGDDAQNREHRAFFGFDTSSLPPDRIVTSARLRLSVANTFGDPSALGELVTDMAVPSFGAPPLALTDYAEPATIPAANLLTPLPPKGALTLYIELGAAALAELETADAVQFRIAFDTGSNSDARSDGYLFFTAENGPTNPYSPELIVEYDIDLCEGCGEQGIDSGNAAANVVDVFRSNGAQDGFVTESEEDSDVGLTANSFSNTLLVGDTAQRKQQIGILSFNTAAIPADAFIVDAQISMTVFSVSNQPETLGNLVVDMRCPNKGSFYGTSVNLEPADFQSFSFLEEVATLTPVAGVSFGDVVSGSLDAAGRRAINRDGVTQFKVRFQLDDNNDERADWIGFYTGSTANAASQRPTLTVTWRPAP